MQSLICDFCQKSPSLASYQCLHQIQRRQLQMAYSWHLSLRPWVHNSRRPWQITVVTYLASMTTWIYHCACTLSSNRLISRRFAFICFHCVPSVYSHSIFKVSHPQTLWAVAQGVILSKLPGKEPYGGWHDLYFRLFHNIPKRLQWWPRWKSMPVQLLHCQEKLRLDKLEIFVRKRWKALKNFKDFQSTSFAQSVLSMSPWVSASGWSFVTVHDCHARSSAVQPSPHCLSSSLWKIRAASTYLQFTNISKVKPHHKEAKGFTIWTVSLSPVQ